MKPPTYGEWWNTNDVGLDWYKMIYAYREKAHRRFIDWFHNELLRGTRISSILEVGCGRGHPYADLFRDYEYTGYDISEKEIAWCRSARSHPRHTFRHCDFLALENTEQFDLVFSHAVIDHVYDVNLFLKRMVQSARVALFVAAYRGWFPDLSSHQYSWTDSVTCFHNAIAPAEARAVLLGLGCRSVEVVPVRCDNPHDKVEYETAIIAYK